MTILSEQHDKNVTHNIKGSIKDNNIPPTPRSLKIRLLELLQNAGVSEKLHNSLTEWLEYKNFKYQEIGLKKLITLSQHNLNEFGETAVCNLIDECISNMWKGIIWDKLKKAKEDKPPPQKITGYESTLSKYEH